MDGPFDPGRTLVTVLVIAVASYAYVLAILGRHPVPPGPADRRPLFFAVLVPCLNEALVIGQTLETLCALRGRLHILVIDDDSDDDSLEVVRRFPASLVTVLELRGTDARVGKGAALDHGYREIQRWGLDRLYDPEHVIVVVFDADSRVPPDFLERVTPYFGDPEVVGVQSAVRMFNAGRNVLTAWQHFEFVVWAQVFARAKDRLGSATLGGNGQCVRLSALLPMGASPWRPSLTEDLDLSLRLILRRGRIRFCGETHVAQEAVQRLPRLVRQRARWVQGHLVAWEHLPAIPGSAAPVQARLDLLAFLLLPAALVPMALATVDGWLTLFAGLGSWSIETLVAWYVLAFAFAPLTAWALIREGQTDKGHAIVHAHLFVAYAVVWMTAGGKAVWSIVRGDRAWAKTSREPARTGAVSTSVSGSLTPTARTVPPHGQGTVVRRTMGTFAAPLAATIVIVCASAVLVAAAIAAASTYDEATRPRTPAAIVDRSAMSGPTPAPNADVPGRNP